MPDIVETRLSPDEIRTRRDAMRDAIVSVLMSPFFCYRIDLVEAGGSAVSDGSRRRQEAGAAVATPKFASLSQTVSLSNRAPAVSVAETGLCRTARGSPLTLAKKP